MDDRGGGGMIPPDQTPRDACANLCMEFRGQAEHYRTLALNGADQIHCNALASQFTQWSSRLERACQRMDQEKTGDPKFILRETAEAYNDACADGLDADSAHDMAMGVLAGLLGIAPQTPDVLGAVSPTAPPAEQDTPQ